MIAYSGDGAERCEGDIQCGDSDAATVMVGGGCSGRDRRWLCGEELRGLGGHLVWGALERGDPEEHEPGQDCNLE